MKTLDTGFARRSYDLDDLGLFNREPDKALDLLTLQAANCACSGIGAITMIDETASRIVQRFTRAAHSSEVERKSLEIHGTVTERCVERGELVEGTWGNCAMKRPDLDHLPRFQSFMCSPVFDPAKTPVGAVFMFKNSSRPWKTTEIARLKDVGYLVSQQILLRAAFATIRIISGELNDLAHTRTIN